MKLPENNLLTIKQVSEALNVHANTLRNWERQGLITAIRIGNRKDRRYDPKEISRVMFKNIILK